MGSGQLEWFEPAGPKPAVIGRAPILGSGPGDVAAAAAKLLRELRRPPRDCVLVLADELLNEKVVHLPRLSGRERRIALRRKAANLTASKERTTVFGALRLGSEQRDDGRREEVLEKWLLIATQRAFVAGLELQLRRRGLRVQRVVPARLTSLGHQALHGSQPAGARAVVGIGAGAAVLSLVQGGSLVHQTLLAGSFGPSSALGATLVQELRGLDLFWRKTSRGDSIAEVVVIGIEAADSIRLAPAICAALPGTGARLYPALDAAGPDAGRAEALEAALHPNAFGLDLAVPLPPRARAVAGLTLTLGLLASGLGVIGQDRLEQRRQSWMSAAGMLHQLSSDLPAVVRERTEREQSLERLAARYRRLEALDRLGVPFEAILLDVAEAFGERATLETLAVTPGPLGLRLDVTGETSGDPVRGFLALQEIRRTLEANPRYRAIELKAPPLLPERDLGQRTRAGTLSFGLRAACEVRR